MTNPKLTINKYKYVIALGVFAIYLCISFYKISINSLWYDEGFSIDLANCSLEEITQYSLYYDTNPPLYLYILHYWMQLFGESELASQIRNLCFERESASVIAQSDSQLTIWVNDVPPAVGVYRTWIHNAQTNDWHAELKKAREDLSRVALESLVLCGFSFL